jgi:hypothetical protein
MMTLMEIWINPDCSKCRSALSSLDAEGALYTVRRYLEAPPSVEEIEDVLQRLGLQPWDITRLGEPLAAELGNPDPAADHYRRRRHRGGGPLTRSGSFCAAVDPPPARTPSRTPSRTKVY